MIKVEVVTLERLVHETEGDEVIIPTVEGEIGILHGHLPLVTLLKAGQIVVKHSNGTEELFAVNGGFVEIANNTVRVLADTAERAEELDEKVVQEAIARAEKLKTEATSEHDVISARAQIEANFARLKVIKRRHSRSHHQPHITD